MKGFSHQLLFCFFFFQFFCRTFCAFHYCTAQYPVKLISECIFDTSGDGPSDISVISIDNNFLNPYYLTTNEVLTVGNPRNIILQSTSGPVKFIVSSSGQLTGTQSPIGCGASAGQFYFEFNSLYFFSDDPNEQRTSPVINLTSISLITVDRMDFTDFSVAGPLVLLSGKSSLVLSTMNFLRIKNDPVQQEGILRVDTDVSTNDGCTTSLNFHNYKYNTGPSLFVRALSLQLTTLLFANNTCGDSCTFLDLRIDHVADLNFLEGRFSSRGTEFASTKVPSLFITTGCPNFLPSPVGNQFTISQTNWKQYNMFSNQPLVYIETTHDICNSGIVGRGAVLFETLYFIQNKGTLFELQDSFWNQDVVFQSFYVIHIPSQVDSFIFNFENQPLTPAGRTLNANFEDFNCYHIGGMKITGAEKTEVLNSHFLNMNFHGFYIDKTSTVNFDHVLFSEGEVDAAITVYQRDLLSSSFVFDASGLVFQGINCQKSPVYFPHSSSMINAVCELQFNSTTFLNCTGSKGGAISLTFPNSTEISLSMEIQNSNFQNCQATYGGAIYLSYPTIPGVVLFPLVIQDSNFTNNFASQSGGAIYLTKPKNFGNDILNNLFINNCAGTLTGANTLNQENFLTFSDSTNTIIESECPPITTKTTKTTSTTKTTTTTKSTTTTTTTTTTIPITSPATTTTMTPSTTSSQITTTTKPTSTTTSTNNQNTGPVLCLLDPPTYFDTILECMLSISCPQYQYQCCDGQCVTNVSDCLESDSLCATKSNNVCGYSLLANHSKSTLSNSDICWSYCPSSFNQSSSLTSSSIYCTFGDWENCNADPLAQYVPCNDFDILVPFSAPLVRTDIPVYGKSGILLALLSFVTNGVPTRVIVEEGIGYNDTRKSKLMSTSISLSLQNGQHDGLFLNLTLRILDSHFKNKKIDDLCLAYFDEKNQTWLCVDHSINCFEVLESGNIVHFCTGASPHLTSFAILLGGLSNHQDFAYTIASLSLIGFAIVVGLVICFVPPVSRLFYGERGTDIREIRKEYKNDRYDDSQQTSDHTVLPNNQEPQENVASLPVITCEDDL